MARKNSISTIFVTGCKNNTWPPPKTVLKELKKIITAMWPVDTGYIITGTSRVVDTKVVAACKQLNVRVLQAPANFQLLSGASAEQLRNADMLQTFKPECIVVFTDKELTEDSVLAHLSKLAYKAYTHIIVVRKHTVQDKTRQKKK